MGLLCWPCFRGRRQRRPQLIFKDEPAGRVLTKVAPETDRPPQPGPSLVAENVPPMPLMDCSSPYTAAPVADTMDIPTMDVALPSLPMPAVDHTSPTNQHFVTAVTPPTNSTSPNTDISATTTIPLSSSTEVGLPLEILQKRIPDSCCPAGAPLSVDGPPDTPSMLQDVPLTGPPAFSDFGCSTRPNPYDDQDDRDKDADGVSTPLTRPFSLPIVTPEPNCTSPNTDISAITTISISSSSEAGMPLDLLQKSLQDSCCPSRAPLSVDGPPDTPSMLQDVPLTGPPAFSDFGCSTSPNPYDDKDDRDKDADGVSIPLTRPFSLPIVTPEPNCTSPNTDISAVTTISTSSSSEAGMPLDLLQKSLPDSCCPAGAPLSVDGPPDMPSMLQDVPFSGPSPFLAFGRSRSPKSREHQGDSDKDADGVLAIDGLPDTPSTLQGVMLIDNI